MCNHFAIVLLLELIVLALGLDHVVGLGVDVGGLVEEILHLLLLRLPFDLIVLERLVTFLMELEACHSGPQRKLIHLVFMVILMRLDMFFPL